MRAPRLIPATFRRGFLWCGGVRELPCMGFVPPPSPPFFCSGLREGGMWFLALSCRGFVVSAAACPGLGSLGLRPTFPSRLGCAHFFFAHHCSSGVCVDVSGVSFPLLGRCSRLDVAGFCRAVLRCAFEGPLRCCLGCCLAGGFARLLWSGCAASRPCVRLLSPPPLFWGGVLPVPPSALPRLVHALDGIRCG